MDNSFSFKYIKLGSSLVFLLVSSILPGIIGKYVCLVLGGILLMTAFASLGNYDYRGVPSKLFYRIVRYVIAAFLLFTGGIQIDFAINLPDFIDYSLYATILDCSLISYLLFFKPSNTSMIKKILKVLGYVLVFIGVNALRNTREEVEHLTYTSEEIQWGMVFMIIVVFILGIGCIILGNRKS